MLQTKFLEKIKARISCSVPFIFFLNRALYETIWKIILQRGRPQITIRRMRIACWIPMYTNTHSECALRIALPLQQWLHERPQCYVICPLSILLSTEETISFLDRLKYDTSNSAVFTFVA